MKEYSHGGEIYDKKVDMDFSVNINPLGLPEEVKKALACQIESFSLYPDNDCNTLRQAISEKEQIKKEHVICGNGASDLIFRICYSLKPKKGLLLSPTFSEYEKALASTGCSIQYYNLREENGFSLTGDFFKSLNETIDILFLCNPNNPVGNLIDRGVLEEIEEICKKYHIFLVVDECFLDFTKRAELSLKDKIDGNENLFILKAFTKLYAMAGLRLGYGFCTNRRLLEEMGRAGAAWSVSIPAQIAGIRALKEEDYVKRALKLIKIERDYLQNALKSLDLTVFEPAANYIFFKGKETLYEELLQKGILIRHCDNYRQLNKTYYRIGIRNHEENEKLIKAIKESINKP